MDLKILSVHEQGNALEEYVLLEALNPCDIGYYAVADTTFTSATTMSNKLRHFFWFPDKIVDRGDLIVLRTGRGNTDEFVNVNHRKVHRFFWQLDRPVWNNTGDGAVLFQMKTWKATAA